MLLALALAATGDLEEAEALLAEAVRRDPAAALPRLWHAQVLDDLGRAQEATAAFRAALEVRPVRRDDGLLVAGRVLACRPALAPEVRDLVGVYVEAFGPSHEAEALLATSRRSGPSRE
jgi:tetratricopeptide (TPR) repeat protein